jgi:hypothetical protein
MVKSIHDSSYLIHFGLTNPLNHFNLYSDYMYVVIFSCLVHIYIQTNTDIILYPFALSHWLFNLVLNLCSLIIIHYSSMFIILNVLLSKSPKLTKGMNALSISTFLVIDDNTFKAYMGFDK